MLQKKDVANAHCVYIAPVEAPAEEWYYDWESKFGQKLGVRVVELIGETAADIKLSIAMSSARVWGIYMKAWVLESGQMYMTCLL
jgi:hypothetical protein